MLKSLLVQNYALIDHLEIDFSDGFTAITGETGAGKSILLGALGLILGNRADLNVLKDTNQKCLVEGVFDTSHLNLDTFFKENDLDIEPATTIRREISASGKSRAFINDTPVNLQQLKDLGFFLVDIHSQHETLQLGEAAFQLEVLDSFIHRSELLAAYLREYVNYKEVTSHLEQLQHQRNELRRQEDLLRFQYEELSGVDLNSDNFDQLEERLRFLNHAEEIKNTLALATALLDEGQNPVIESLQQIVRSMDKIKNVFPAAESQSQRFQSVIIEVKDVLSEIQAQLLDTEFSPGEWEMLTQKMDALNKLMFKHHVKDMQGLQQLKASIDQQLAGVEKLEEDILQAEKRLSLSRLGVRAKANELNDERTKHAVLFSRQVQELLPSLGMKEAVFTAKVERLSVFNEKGNDKVTFWFSANKGVAPGEISRMASGGELSRLMLAVKTLITKEQMLPTVIFDEIDSGVSGDIAGRVGLMMKQMGAHHQVISISHLPQIAAAAGCQLKVYKTTDTQNTFTRIKTLSQPERVDEIAQMISSERITDATRQAARELLNG